RPDGPAAAASGPVSMAKPAPPDRTPAGEAPAAGHDHLGRDDHTAPLPTHPDRAADTAQLPTLPPDGKEGGPS
ncbi:hypothetical protein ABZS54_35435, partial [Embleya sp. NPDC005575]